MHVWHTDLLRMASPARTQEENNKVGEEVCCQRIERWFYSFSCTHRQQCLMVTSNKTTTVRQNAVKQDKTLISFLQSPPLPPQQCFKMRRKNKMMKQGVKGKGIKGKGAGKVRYAHPCCPVPHTESANLSSSSQRRLGCCSGPWNGLTRSAHQLQHRLLSLPLPPCRPECTHIVIC